MYLFLAQNCDDVLTRAPAAAPAALACLCVCMRSIIHLIKLFLLKLNFIIQFFFCCSKFFLFCVRWGVSECVCIL